MKKLATFLIVFMMICTVAIGADLKMIGSASFIGFEMEGEDYITKVYYSAEIANLSKDDGYVVFYCKAKDKDGNVIETRGVDSNVKTFLIKPNTVRNIPVTFSFRNLIGKAEIYTIYTKQVKTIRL